MYKEDLYILAYERIKSKPGNMTPGTDEETLDGFSLEAIGEIIQEMRTEQFRFKPVRTTFIPKANSKMRKLGIPIWVSYCLSFQAMVGIPIVASAGGPEAPIHPHIATLPRSASVDQSDDVSRVVGSACEAL
jgi:hypothetical protein